MQVQIELPDELGKQLLKIPNMQLLVQKAVEKMLFEEQEKKELPLFERLRFIDDESAEDDIASLFERDKDTGRNFEI